MNNDAICEFLASPSAQYKLGLFVACGAFVGWTLMESLFWFVGCLFGIKRQR
jgi:uncharacterized membrane protein